MSLGLPRHIFRLMASNMIFDEDEVCIPTSTNEYKYGLVVETSEFLSSDEEEDEPIKKGEVKVCWHPIGDETIISENKLILADRSLMPGDVVRRLISGTDSQRGFVQDMSVKCHVRILGTDQFIRNVNARDISPIQVWDLEPEVTLDSWVGHILDVIEDITVRFQDGARCCLSNAGSLCLEDVHDKRKRLSEFAMLNFYPGQELRGNRFDYESAKWLQTTRTRGPGKSGTKALYSAPVVVEKVEVSRVDVRWICKGFTKTGDSDIKLETPPSCVQGDKLKHMRQMDCFRFCHLQIGDKGYYTIKETDTIQHNPSHQVQTAPDILEQISENPTSVTASQPDPTSEAEAGGEDASLNKDTITIMKVDEKDDGNLEQGDEDLADYADDEFEDIDDASKMSGTEVTSQTQLKQKSRKRFTYSTRNSKVNKGKRSKAKSAQSEIEYKAGDKVPVEVCYSFSLCSVMWQDGSLEADIPSPDLFPIHHLDEMEYFPGDFVVASSESLKTDYGVVTSCDHTERTVMVRWIKPYSNEGKPQKPEMSSTEELSVYDVTDHTDFKFRAGHTVIRVGGYENDPGDLEAVGQVYKLNPDGTLDVWWPSRRITQCYPQDLYIISEEFHSELGSSDGWSDEGEEEEEEEEEEDEEGEEEGSDVSWETENETEEDTDTEDSKHDKNKELWYLTDEKKKELDELLTRAEASLIVLMGTLISASDCQVKNARDILRNILHIYKKCKDMEKLLKSPYFSDSDMDDMIANVREQLKREKTAEIARHVAHIYRSRSGTLGQETETGTTQNTESQTVEEAGATSAPALEPTCATQNLESKLEQTFQHLKDTLDKYGTNSNDPAFKEVVASVAAKYAQQRQSQTSPNLNMCKILDIVMHIENSTMAKDLQKLNDKDENGCCSAGPISPAGHEDKPSDTGTHKTNSSKEHTNKEDYQEENMTSYQRQLCINVLKALNLRLVFIKEDIAQRWLANKLGFNEGNTEKDLLEKLQLKSEDSVQSGDGLINLVLDNEPEMRSDATEGACNTTEDNSQDVAQTEGACNTTEDNNLDIGQTENNSSSPEPVEVENNNENKPEPEAVEESFHRLEICSETPANHKFKSQEFNPNDPKAFNKAIRKEMMLFRSSLPDGILVKGFEDRMDLMSVLIKGPTHTPYEGGLFSFDVQLPSNFPLGPPTFHYVAFCSERLNPNLYEDGKVCVSLLGTWSGKGSELWNEKSSLLQVLVSIQGLILVAEPYFNEAGYEKQRGTQHGQENSRMYNEMAILKLVQSMTKMALSPPTVFEEETRQHIEATGKSMVERISRWISLSESNQVKIRSTEGQGSSDSPPDTVMDSDESAKPPFPLLPASRGFCISMKKYLKIFDETLDSVILKKDV